MRLQTKSARPGAARVTLAILALTLGGLTGCSDDGADSDASDGDTAGVDTPPSSAASTPDTSSSAAAADVLSSFSDSFDDDHNGWALPPSELGTTTIAGGDFVWDDAAFELRPHVLASIVAEAFDAGRLEMTDVQVTASVTAERGAPAVGVFCREVPDTDADFQWYEFVVRDGYAAIRVADSNGDLEPLAETEDAALPIGTAATIEASCVDGTDGSAALSLSLDGAELLTAEASDPLGNGGAGLQAYGASEDEVDEPSRIVWHDFAVEPAG
jgi:hypothetical protein